MITRKLTLGFNIWGVTDIHGEQDDAASRTDLSRSFSEYRLSHNILGERIGFPDLGLQAESNGVSGSGNDVLRFGLTYKHNLIKLSPFSQQSGWRQWRGSPIETDGNGAQISLGYFLLLHDKIHITGFADSNFSEGGSDRWVIEPQLTIQIYNQIWGIIEFRYNGFEDANPSLDGKDWAAGIRVDF